MKNLSLGNKLIFICNVLFLFMWLVAYFAPYINPEIFSFASIFAIAYPVLIFVHILFVLYWIVQFKKVVFYSIIALAISYLFATPIFKSKHKFKALAKDRSFSVLSFNSQMSYFLGGSKKQVQENQSNIIHFLNQENADIVCIQEARKGIDINLNYPYKSIFDFNHIYSKYKIIDAKEFVFKEISTNKSSYVDVLVHGDTIRVYNLHLESLHLNKENYQLNDEWKSQNGNLPSQNKSENISKKINLATKKRIDQTMSIVMSIQNCPYPSMICGDFNEVSQSYIYRKLSRHHKDAFIKSGKGFGATYSRFFFPFRIDYILVDEIWSPFNFEVLDGNISDHQAIRCDIEMN
tara:strand:+ start:7604 stop:8650 length:1047 start_codon:yes stop_codon:yes gene_type:complete